MKTLSLVDCVELKFSGNILKNGICFGDVDNDGNYELVVGSCNGDLSIFRSNYKIYASANLGEIAAVCVGDLLNIRKNVLVVVTMEGWCHIFDVESEAHGLQNNNKQAENEHECTLILPFHSQRIPPNAKSLHLGDVNEDGLTELVVGLTDRVLRTYVWKTELIFDYQQQDERNLSKSDEKDDEDNKSECIEDGRLFGLNKWEFANQIGSVALHKHDKYCSILVGQPGGSVLHIVETKSKRCGPPAPSSISSSSNQPSSSGSSGANNNTNKRTPQERPMVSNESPSDNIQIEFYPLDIARMQNPNISTEVAALDDDDCWAVATLDGTINITRGNKIEQSLVIDNTILSIHQVNGKLIVCSWNGDTYLIDVHQKDPIRFHFEDSVAAFSAGLYAMDLSSENKLVNTTAFAFATFGERVFVYNTEYL